MSRYFAAIKENIVTDPIGIVAQNGPGVILASSIGWCQDNFPDFSWIETHNPTEPLTDEEFKQDSTCLNCKNFAGPGFEVFTDKNGFIQTCPPKPRLYLSWILICNNTFCGYTAPIEQPDYIDNKQGLVWDEKNLSWIIVDIDKVNTTQKQKDDLLEIK